MFCLSFIKTYTGPFDIFFYNTTKGSVYVFRIVRLYNNSPLKASVISWYSLPER